MKTRLLIIIGIITAIALSLLVSDQYYLSLQDQEIKKSDWVQNCVLPEDNQAVPSIGLYNHTHSFDLLTCTWNPTEHGTPGFLESLYISFIEPIFFDITDSLEIKYAYAGCTATIIPQPCFDSFLVSHEFLTEELVMDTIYRNLDTNYKGWMQTDRNWSNNDEGYDHPTIICTAFDWKGQTHYRMLQWKDDYRISSLEDYRNDSMCDKWFPPKSLDATNPSFDCKEAVKNNIPTDWKYNCYDEPLRNPLRDISLSNYDDPQRLEFILNHCEKHGPLDYVGQLRYLNDTHLIDLDTCEWDARTNSGVSLDRTIYPVPFSEEKSEQDKALCEDENTALKDGICVPKPFDFRESESNMIMLYVYSGLGLAGTVAGFFAIQKWRNKK